MDKRIPLYCTNCGKKYIRENQKFCAYCGDRCIDDFESPINESGEHIENVEVFHKREQTPRSLLQDITHDFTRTNTMQTDNASRGNVMDEINADVDYTDNDSMKNPRLHLKKETLEKDCDYDCCLDGGKAFRDSHERTSSMKEAIVRRNEIDHRTDSAIEEIVANKTLIDGRQGLRAQEDRMNTKENNGMNNLNDNVNSVVTTTSLQPAPFLLKTYNVVSDEQTIDMVAWAPDGRRYE